MSPCQKFIDGAQMSSGTARTIAVGGRLRKPAIGSAVLPAEVWSQPIEPLLSLRPKETSVSQRASLLSLDSSSPPPGSLLTRNHRLELRPPRHGRFYRLRPLRAG